MCAVDLRKGIAGAERSSTARIRVSSIPIKIEKGRRCEEREGFAARDRLWGAGPDGCRYVLMYAMWRI